MNDPTADGRTRRGWQRGLMLSGLALALAWTFHAADRRARPRPSAPEGPPATPVAMPADTSLTASSGGQALPRLLVLLPDAGDAALPPARLADLKRACEGRLVIREGDAAVAGALGLDLLPAFVIYGNDGRELRRLSGPDAIDDLRTELGKLGITIGSWTPGGAP